MSPSKAAAILHLGTNGTINDIAVLQSGWRRWVSFVRFRGVSFVSASALTADIV
jgi:hypothetical protein